MKKMSSILVATLLSSIALAETPAQKISATDCIEKNIESTTPANGASGQIANDSMKIVKKMNENAPQPFEVEFKDISLLGSDLDDPEKCKEKIKAMKEFMISLEASVKKENKTISVDNMDNFVANACKGLKASQESRKKEAKAMHDLYMMSYETTKSENDLKNAKKLEKAGYFDGKDGEKIWSFSVKLSGTILSGNTNQIIADAGAKAQGNFKTHTLKITTNGQLKKTDEDNFRSFNASIDDSIELGQLTSLSDSWAAFANASYSHDQSKGIKHNTEVLVGTGYNFLGDYNGSKEKLKLSVGFGYRTKTNMDGTKENHSIVSTRVKFEKPITETVSVNTTAWHKVNPADIKDFNTSLSAGVKFKVGKQTDCSISYSNEYDNTPVEGKSSTDNKTVFGCEHKF